MDSKTLDRLMFQRWRVLRVQWAVEHETEPTDRLYVDDTWDVAEETSIGRGIRQSNYEETERRSK